jgi:excisionase family DNA binding protein
MNTAMSAAGIRMCVEEAARYVGLGVSKLNKLRTYGGGPAYAKLGRRVVYDAADLDAWLAENKRSSTAARERLAA